MKQTLIPTQLFVGPQEITEEKTELFLQGMFCKNNSNIETCFCNSCRKIKNQQHESIVWISPEKNYTVKDIEIVFEKINFALDKEQKFFFVLKKAHTLNLASANKLLKVLEEPPEGYNFILQTNNPNSILPTILSRCHIINFSDNNDCHNTSETHPILLFFLQQRLLSPQEFEKELKYQDLTDNQSFELANNLLIIFAKKINSFYKEEQIDIKEIKYLEEIYEYLKEKLKKPPQSGSSSSFWKNLYISFPKKQI